MDEDFIDQIASSLAAELKEAKHVENADIAIYRITERLAAIIHSENPTYDMRYFYRNSGYPEPYPIHDMR